MELIATARRPASCHARATSRAATFWRKTSTGPSRMSALRPAGSGHVLDTPRRFEVEAPPDAANAGNAAMVPPPIKNFLPENYPMISSAYAQAPEQPARPREGARIAE
jgi:hypothetical protein